MKSGNSGGLKVKKVNRIISESIRIKLIISGNLILCIFLYTCRDTSCPNPVLTRIEHISRKNDE
ncbi:hypothetical protein [Clostridium sp. HBUAS56017]|uniref:Uncharacterized protein n=1 Tax=Clostridium cibarium TaxID=2762247 RepID=A0ABR8PYA6_9CLOT|nr:hypothetical protein [Clostridium sp. HBUAS56017]MBD7913153.1 hypothetical protein [Clostridium cibarium]